jgi:hypothetical protein
MANTIVEPELYENQREREDELSRLENAIVQARHVAGEKNFDEQDVADEQKNQNQPRPSDEPTTGRRTLASWVVAFAVTRILRDGDQGRNLK